jgi:hypothetical protein
MMYGGEFLFDGGVGPPVQWHWRPPWRGMWRDPMSKTTLVRGKRVQDAASTAEGAMSLVFDISLGGWVVPGLL